MSLETLYRSIEMVLKILVLCFKNMSLIHDCNCEISAKSSEPIQWLRRI